MGAMLNDIRYGIRMLAKKPGFALVIVLTLALGIGANTAIFSVVNNVLIHPLPFANSNRLVWAWGRFALSDEAAVSPPDFLDYRKQNQSFEDFSAFFVEGAEPENLSVHGEGEQVRATMATSGFFETLGAKPLLGRSFSVVDEQVSDPQSVILSYHIWQRKFGADPGVVGRSVNFDGRSTTVAGVMPRDFDYPPQTDVWFPTPMLAGGMQQRPARFLRPIGLLKPGVTLEQAQSDCDSIAHRLAERYPSADRGYRLLLDSMENAIVGPSRSPLLLLLAAVGLVLLIACANVANLLLARNDGRQKEFAIRSALGAGSGRIVRQLLAESMILAIVGGGVGVLLALWGIDLLRFLGPASLPNLHDVHLDGTVLVFTAALSLLTGILFGLAPALQSAKPNLQNSLKEGGRSSVGMGHRRLRSALMISEVAISVALLIGAGLLLNSLWRMLHVKPGFDPSGVLTAQIILSDSPYATDAKRAAFFGEFFKNLRGLPGVTAAGGVSELPLSGQMNDDFFTTDTAPPKETQDTDDADSRIVAGEYFQAMRIPLLEGRLFSQQDEADVPHKVIVDEPFVRRYFSKVDPIGKHLLVYEGTHGYLSQEIVGVVGGIHHIGLQVPARATMYFPATQSSQSQLTIVVRGTGDPAQLASSIRHAVATIDPNEALSDFEAMAHIVAKSAAGDRFNALLLGVFGVVALLLAAAGIYGVMSYAVAQRTREIGIRLALGAQPRAALRMVIQDGMKLVAVGIVLGLLMAGGLTRLMASQLYGVHTVDPSTFAVAVIVLSAAAMLACYVPARRAARVDPIVALRYE